MTDYILTISSFSGIVYGATHYRGTVRGPHPRSCHGGEIFHGWDGPLKGKTTCSQGHEIPRQDEWDVDADWTEDMYTRWAAGRFEADGPAQFRDVGYLIDTAVRRFRGEIPERHRRLAPAIAGRPGDRLFLGFVSTLENPPDEEWALARGYPVAYGALLAQIPDQEGRDDGPEGQGPGERDVRGEHGADAG